jgi:hypothetical protein
MAVDENGNEIIETSPESESSKRIKQLSEKVRLTSEERDEKDRLLGESNKKIADLERENTFNSGFADILGTHSAAKDHKDDIKAKVLSGMTVEDATFAVLGKAGKLGTPVVTQPNAGQVAGGSATITPPQGGSKSVGEMTQAERREQLAKDLIWT